LEAQIARSSQDAYDLAVLGIEGLLTVGILIYVVLDATKASMIFRALVAGGLASLIVAPGIAALAALAAFVRLLMSPFSACSRERSARRKALKRARKEADRVNQGWRVVVTEYEHQFRETRARIEAACESVRSLGREFTRERKRLVALQEQHFDEIRRATGRLLEVNAEARERVAAFEPMLEVRARALAQAQANMELFRR
jgi:hypothetical protein